MGEEKEKRRMSSCTCLEHMELKVSFLSFIDIEWWILNIVIGYAGSSIQLAIIQYLYDQRLYHKSGGERKLPTIVFVHALNPYGMKMWRRVNENNVDLNRNFIVPSNHQLFI